MQIDFDSPWYLLLLAGLPVLWWASLRTLSAFGRVRRFTAIALRSVIFVLLVLALAEVQWVRTSNRLTVLYLLDQSLSVSQEQSDAMIDYINKAIARQRDGAREDRAGVIVFGREAAIEIPPMDDDQSMPRVETAVDREHTNLAGAMKLAQASFPHDAAKRVVVISDGNQNAGDALDQARALANSGIGIDVVPIRSRVFGEVAVEKVTIPSDVRRGQPFDLRVVLANTAGEGQQPRSVDGRLIVVRKAGGREQVLTEQDITLEPGKRVFSIREEIEQPEFYTYEARFVPKDAASDTLPQNNQATAFTHVRGSGQVLLIEDHENRGEFDYLVERLRAMNLEVTLRSTRPDELFTDLAQLQPYDTVLLANVPREHFGDDQVEMLVRNTRNMGAGLVMLGGPNSFGAGGWTNTLLEEAMPVDFQIKNAKVAPVGALAMVMHASELPDGNHWQKVVAREALKALGDQDYCGVVHWGITREEWLWNGLLKVGPNRRSMLTRLDRMTPGDMPDFESSLQMALIDFRRLSDAAVKHMIIISDGDPAPPNYGPGGAIPALTRIGVKISTVAIGTHGPPGSTPLQTIANRTGGKYYVVTNAKTLPRIYQKEARRVARPLVFEREGGFSPQIRLQHEMVQGIENPLPPITGFVLTTPKSNPLAEISVVSPLPSGTEVNPILASWTYGLGKSVAFTTDAGKRWASAWTGWQNYDRFMSQIVRWSMRPTDESGKFTVSTDVVDGKVKVVVTALNAEDEFLNFLNLESMVVGPDLKPVDLNVTQTAPGRYVGEFDAKASGSYLVLVSPGAGRAPIRTGVSIPYSDEFRDRDTNIGLLESMARTKPKDGAAGKLIDAPDQLPAEQRQARLLGTNTFRHDLAKATSSQSVWPLLLMIAACLFVGDVFVRRVTISLDWLLPWARSVIDRLLGREARPDVTVTMERLISRKAAVTGQLEQKRAALRFEPTPEATGDLAALDEEAAAPVGATPGKEKSSLAAEREEDSYTERLLKAKKKAQGGRRPDKPPEGPPTA
ncbi:MAG: VWA domain-containing protein [Pirellulales bacterium]